MLRSHDLVFADGTFRVLMTPRQHVFAVLDVRTSPIGPLHVALDIDRSAQLPDYISPTVFQDPASAQVPELSQAMQAASEHTFDEASDFAPQIARPMIQLARNAAGEGAEFIWRANPTQLDQQHAAHLLMRVRLGDLEARRRVQRIIEDAHAGMTGAQGVAAALMNANAFVAEAVDVPVANVAQMQAAGAPMAPSRIEQYNRVARGARRSKWGAVARFLKDHSSEIQGAASMVPGIGTGLSVGIGAGTAALNHDHPIDIAIRAAYAAIPIPPGPTRKATDFALNTVLGFVDNPHNLTDVALRNAREQLPVGVPRDVFDTLTHILVRHVPIQQEAMALASTVAGQYVAPALGLPPVAANNQHAPSIGAVAANIGAGLLTSFLKGKSA